MLDVHYQIVIIFLLISSFEIIRMIRDYGGKK
jgi:hypothetical protein